MALTIGGNAGDVNYAQDQATATQDARKITYSVPQDIQNAISQTPLQDDEKQELTRAIADLQTQLDTQVPDEGLIKQLLRKIRDTSPDVLEVVSRFFIDPLGAAGLAIDKILGEDE